MFLKRPALWLAVLLTVVFVFGAFIRVGFLESLELSSYDLRMKLRAAGPGTKTDVAVIEIDNDSITKLGRWPWPRWRIAQMIDKIKGYGSRVIGLIVMFSEPEKGEGLTLLEELKTEFTSRYGASGDQNSQAFLTKLVLARDKLDNDARLEKSLAGAGNVILPVFLEMGEYAQAEKNPPEILLKNALMQAQGSALQYLYVANKITLPIGRFADNVQGLGHINTRADGDGAIRREMLLLNYKGLAFPSFSLKLALQAQGIVPATVKVFSPEEGREGLRIGQKTVPTNPNLDFNITFTDSKAFPRFSFFDVFNDKVDPAAFKDKVVLIGVSALGVDTPLVTPLDKHMSTAMFMANTVQNLLHGGFITRSGLWDLIELLYLILIGLFLALLLPRLKALTGAVASGALLAVTLTAGIYLFLGPGIWFKITYAFLLTLLGYGAVTTIGYFITETGRDKAVGESAEVNRMLGLSFQNQGQLDMAFDKFRRVPMDDGMKEILYNLALDYERKRMFNKAVSVYQYISEYDSNFKDIGAKIKKLTAASETMIFGLGTGASRGEDGTLVINEDTKPTLGRYEITKELGKGAMGIVYMGRDPKIGRITAIKTIRFTEEYEEEEAARLKEQFFHEAETAGMLSHPNIVTIYDAGEDHDLAYIAMEYLEGTDLKEYARPDNLLPMKEVLRLVADVAEALGYAHTKGVVHRDIKPANIMLVNNGIAKVTDFGIARAMASSKTKTGVVKGTPFYMSPEQITGKKVDGRTDIYSLGVVLYELLTGVQPFRAEDLTALIYKITSEDPEPIANYNPKVPKAVNQIVDKALTKDREKRYQKGEQMAEHLRIVLKKMDELALRRTNPGS